MPKNNVASTAGGMLSDLKARLGFAHNDDEVEDDDFNEYDDFDDDGFNDRDDREYAGYGADYDDQAPVGAYRPATTRSSRFGRADSTPDLVTIDDVKAHTQVGFPDDAQDDGTRMRTVGGRNVIDDRAPAESSPAYNASVRSRERRSGSRSEGLDSLFEPSAPKAHATDASLSYDPYVAYSSDTPSRYTSMRGLKVIKPYAYADVERVARSVKAGDVVVLAMRNTPDDLSKRVLDFSFGVASALDASVECPGDKVFAIARGAALSEDEKRQLRNQGVL